MDTLLAVHPVWTMRILMPDLNTIPQIDGLVSSRFLYDTMRYEKIFFKFSKADGLKCHLASAQATLC